MLQIRKLITADCRMDKKTKQITATIDHMLKDVNIDCGSCLLQEICDEIEGLREMHFGMSEEHT